MVTALGADELKRAGVATFQLALLDVGRLAPQADRIAVAQLARNRQRHDTLIVNARPRATAIARAALYRKAIRTISRATVGSGVQVCASH